MNDSILHVAFTQSGAGCLRATLGMAGRREEVIASSDSLSFGPIDSPSLKDRLAWIEEELNVEGYREVLEFDRLFWEKVLSDKRRKVLWTSRRSAMEYAGFLECLWRLGDAPCSIADLTEVKVIHRGRDGALGAPVAAVSIAMLSYETILEHGILDLVEPLTSDSRVDCHALWKKLRGENAPFRVVSEQGMASAPITFFDERIVSCITSDWQKSLRVVGEALVKEWPLDCIQASDFEYFARLQKLVEAGRIESRGDISQMRGSEVRLPSTILK